MHVSKVQTNLMSIVELERLRDTENTDVGGEPVKEHTAEVKRQRHLPAKGHAPLLSLK